MNSSFTYKITEEGDSEYSCSWILTLTLAKPFFTPFTIRISVWNPFASSSSLAGEARIWLS